MKITERTITEFSRLLFAKMANKYGGDCTLNELRVMNAAYFFSFNGGQCTPTQIAKETGIPKSTVSRSLASLFEKGWLQDEKDPEDRRRRIITLSDMAMERRTTDWQEAIDWLVMFSDICEKPDCPNAMPPDLRVPEPNDPAETVRF